MTSDYNIFLADEIIGHTGEMWRSWKGGNEQGRLEAVGLRYSVYQVKM